eukprot:3934250-Rhodomonas_salina.1
MHSSTVRLCHLVSPNISSCALTPTCLAILTLRETPIDPVRQSEPHSKINTHANGGGAWSRKGGARVES